MIRPICAMLLSAPLGARAADVEILDTSEKVKALCAATMPADAVKLKGDEVERGLARQKHEAARTKAMETPLMIVLPAKSFALGEYDAQAKELSIDTKKVWPALGGALSVYPAGVDDLTLEGVSEEVARAVSAAKKSGKAQLAVSFLPADTEGGPCVTNAAAKAYTLAVEPLTVELVVDEKPVARLETDAYKDYLASLPPPETGTPAADVTSASVEGAAPTIDEVRKRVAASKNELVGCYQKGLAEKPGLNGTVVIGFTVGKDGKPAEVEMIADSLLVPAVTDCAQGVVKGVSFAALKEPARASVTVSFARRRQ